MKRLLLATRNEGKVRELRQLLGAQSCHLETLATHPEVGEVEETGKSFDENARLKASRSSSMLDSSMTQPTRFRHLNP